MQCLQRNLKIDFIEALKIGKQFKYIEVDVGHHKIPVDETFDIIVLSQVLHFLNRKIRCELLNWCIQHLNKNGILFIRANHTNTRHINQENVVRNSIQDEVSYSYGSLTYFLFEPENIQPELKELIKLKELADYTSEWFTLVHKMS